MTDKELNSLFYLDKEIRKIKARIFALRNESGIGAVSIDGMPHGHSGVSVTERVALKKNALYEYLCELQEEKTDESIRIHQYVYDCPDAEVQSIMSMRYIDQRSWQHIAMELHMDRTTAQRHLHKYLAEH